MILIDTSAWIDYFGRVDTDTSGLVDKALLSNEVIVGDLVLAELLQGVRRDEEVERILRRLGELERQSLCGPDIAELAAANYRFLRRQGVTIRGTIDVIIATWCIVNGATIIHNDRDLTIMERLLGLCAYK